MKISQSFQYQPRKVTPETLFFELNELTKAAKRNAYYAKCKKFIEETVLKEDFDISQLTEKQRKWLYGIKSDLQLMDNQ